MYCRKCGNELGNTDMFCSNCGERIVSDNENVVSVKSVNNDVEYDVTTNSQTEESKFDRFMKKSFFQNKELTNEVLERAGKVNVVGIVLMQLLALALLLLFDIEIPSLGITLFWWWFDCYVLKKQGIRGKWKIWGFICIPVYLCIRAKKTNKKYTWAIISILFSIFVTVCAVVSEFYGGTGVNLNQSLEFNKETYEYSGYVEVDGWDYVDDLRIYFPFQGTYTYEEKPVREVESYTTQKTITYSEGYPCFLYKNPILNGTNDESIQGFYYVDSKGYVVELYPYNILGEQSENTIILPQGRSEIISKDANESRTMETAYETYTVTTEAGIFENCLCVITKQHGWYEDPDLDWGNGTRYYYAYYAPNVGLVLEITRMEDTFSDGIHISQELINITENVISNKQENNENQISSVVEYDYNGTSDEQVLIMKPVTRAMRRAKPTVYGGMVFGVSILILTKKNI